MGRRFESCRAHHYSMKQTIIKNIATGITKKCDILKKNDNFLEVVLEGTTIKITLKKKGEIYVGLFKDMEFTSQG
jgi:hypothetical protein|tara:strand:+ start:9 stop:233 length:225 start_codon:yes stop_codon:yes gene_type:complete